ncbi:MAG: hypothetical protein HYV27_19880 [Candidatus Hydrogenedentes bacterium]|nr:hypothetical protein [Candidatus Hydrogenedentota bacterium]
MTSAIAEIDAGTVRLHANGCNRSWSRFRGVTMELQSGQAREEWLTGRSPEFHLEVDGAPYSALDSAGVVWSEHVGQGWAEVTAEYAFPAIRVRLTTRLYGKVSAIERTLELRNCGPQPCTVAAIAAEILPLDAARVRVVELDTETLALLRESMAYDTFTALQMDQVGLLFGHATPSAFLYFDPNPRFCAIVARNPRTVGRGETRVLQQTLTVPYEGTAMRAARRMAAHGHALNEAAASRE